MKNARTWQQKLRLALSFLSIALFVLILLTTGTVAYTVHQSWPQTNGTLEIAGLEQPVEVLRDRNGVPHLYASTAHDLFLAQGYIHAQDRFWQMDFWRHIGSGRLAELFGPSQLDTDRFLRTLGWARVAQQELETLDTELKSALQAYATGVNAYLADRQGSALSLEYAVLKLLNPSYQPDPWQPLHSLTWAKAMAWDLGGNMAKEIERTRLLQSLSLDRVEDLFPPYPANHPQIVSQAEAEARFNAQQSQHAKESTALSSAMLLSLAPTLQSLSQPLKNLQTLLGPTGSGIGSNSWVLAGDRTTTGKPILANDPHLAVQMPSIWYQMGLHCRTQGVACPYNVVGVSFAGTVGIVIGHNDRIAWGVTNLNPDVMDLYIEKVNPKNPNQYEVNGQWVDMELIPETIQVAGGEPFAQIVRYSRHGPIISDTYPSLDAFDRQTQLPLPQPYAIALRWTALEPSSLEAGIPKLDRAQNWQEFRAAVSHFDVPAQHAIYADVEGNIGYQMPGKIPIRTGSNGRYPVPGWTDEFEWQGYVDFEQLPTLFNPPQGAIAVANTAVAQTAVPTLVTTDWDYGYRAQRIVELLEQFDRPVSLTDMERMQADAYNLNAETLLPVLLSAISDSNKLNDETLTEATLATARNLLSTWDRQQSEAGAAAALFEVFWQKLLAATFQDELPQEYWPDGGDRWFEVVKHAIAQPNSLWWDNRTTPEIEDRDRIFHQAFVAAVAFLQQAQGADPIHWHWGDLHQVTFRNLTLGKSGNGAIETLFNRGPFAVSGGNSIINATAWNASKSFAVTWLPSLRTIVDLGNLEQSRAIHAPGQSGHAFHHHYNDLVDPWRNHQYHPLLWNRKTIEQQTAAKLVLQPSVSNSH